MYRLNSGPHDFGDEGSRIGRERQRQRHEFRDDARAPGKIEALEFGNFKGNGRTEHQRSHERQPDQQAHHIRPDRDQSAALEQLPARVAPQQQRGDDRNQDRQRERLQAGVGDRLWNHETAVGKKEAAKQRDALPRVRQRAEHGEIPEQDLEQQRQIAYQVDIAAGDPRQQPVRRQPAQRNEKSNHGGEEDADDRDQERVEQPDQEHAGISVGSRIRNQVLADVKTRRVVQKPESGG